jgi:hypothetical protein
MSWGVVRVDAWELGDGVAVISSSGQLFSVTVSKQALRCVMVRGV